MASNRRKSGVGNKFKPHSHDRNNRSHNQCHYHNRSHPTNSRANQDEVFTPPLDDRLVRDFSFVKWFFLMGFFDLFAVSLVVPILPIYARSLGMTNTEIGAVVSIFSALQCISSPFVGRWSDIHGRKSTLVWSLFFSSFSYFILGISSWKNALSLFVLGRVIAGIVKHSQTLVRAYFADTMTKENGAVSFSHFLAISNIGYILGPLIGGRMAETQVGFFSICFVAAFLFLLSTIIIEFWIPNLNQNKKTVQQQKPDFFTFISTLEYSKLWDPFLLRFLVTFSTSLYRENFVLILNEKYLVSSKTSGYILSYQAVITVISSFLVAPLLLYTGIYSLLLYCSLILCLTLFCLAACREIWAVLLFLIPFGFCNSILCNVITELIVSRCDIELCGTVVGLGHSIMSLSRMLAPVISGYLLDRNVNGPAKAATSFAVVTVIVTVWVVYRNQGLENNQKNQRSDNNKKKESDNILRCPVHDAECFRPC